MKKTELLSILTLFCFVFGNAHAAGKCGTDNIISFEGYQTPDSSEFIYKTKSLYDAIKKQYNSKNAVKQRITNGTYWECDTQSGCENNTYIWVPKGHVYKGQTVNTDTIYRCNTMIVDGWHTQHVTQCSSYYNPRIYITNAPNDGRVYYAETLNNVCYENDNKSQTAQSSKQTGTSAKQNTAQQKNTNNVAANTKTTQSSKQTGISAKQNTAQPKNTNNAAVNPKTAQSSKQTGTSAQRNTEQSITPKPTTNAPTTNKQDTPNTETKNTTPATPDTSQPPETATPETTAAAKDASQQNTDTTTVTVADSVSEANQQSQTTTTKAPTTENSATIQQESDNTPEPQEAAELSKEESKQKIADLKDNAQKMKEKEQSLANKTLGAAAIGATGIGGMNLMSGMAEQSADESAEEDMKAYLATFVCDYGAGRNIRGGEYNIELPGGNDLISMVNEYRALAADLKVRKTALGKKPGIESEVIIDTADSGLYDNAGTGRQGGAYTSLSRALTDETSADAAAWAKQKQTARDKKNSGFTTAIAGAGGGLAVNTLLNSGDGNLNNILFGGTTKNGTTNINGVSIPGSNNAGNSVANRGATSSLDGEIQRASNAVNTLRGDISNQAETAYNDILSVQSDAENAGIDTTAIKSAVSSATTAKGAIATALSAADKALTTAKKLSAPELADRECDDDAPTEPTAPDRDDDDFECEEGEECPDYDNAVKKYNRQMEKYKTDLAKHQQKVKECQQKAKTDYDTNVRKVVAEAKKQADEAERQMNTGRTELGKIQTALSNATAAKKRGMDAKAAEDARAKADAEKETAEKQKREATQSQISAIATHVQEYADAARRYLTDAQGVQSAVYSATNLNDDESDAEEQVNLLKSNVDTYIGQLKTAADTAEKQIKAATSAGTVDDANKALAEAQRQSDIARQRKESIDAALQEINNAKSAARARYAQSDSEEREYDQEED